MPLLIALPYFLLEVLTFWALASWLGLGWALLVLVLCFFGGLWIAAAEMRRISRAAATHNIDPGRAAGDYGLLAAGAVLVALPGIATSVLGLLLIIPPTRAVVRGILARRFRRAIEDMGVRSFEMTNAYRQRASYGSFSDPNAPQGPETPEHPVIDETEIQEWTSQLDPDDFHDDQDPRQDGSNGRDDR
ncbi:FxsA family protein [Corynebacterium halotolerans]|uniref:FxsA family protein n=1 Tax=Corynebacterium halotolerans TaxID=225326 RepID=UPI003CF1D610